MTRKEKLFRAVMDFMRVTQYCFKNTKSTEDRQAYQSDLALCAKWLLAIDDNVDVKKIIEDILDTTTAKHILDYYKQGKLGDEQAMSFVNLKQEVEKLSNN
jgi:hypoxanthine-guanine phosphoribosyltransferase